MSILSALKETQHDNNNLDDLAKLPQALIMQMAQNGQIPKDMVMPILGKKAELAEAMAKMTAAKQLAAQGGTQPTIMEQYMGQIAQAENPAPVAPPMPQQEMPMPQQMAQSPMPQGPEDVGIASQATAPMQMAGGGIIAFEGGGDVDDEEEDRYEESKRKAKTNANFASIRQMIGDLEGMPVSDYSDNRGVGIAAGYQGAERGMEGDIESRLRAAIMQKESAGKRYDKNGNLLTSSKGALGEMQVMPATARDPGFGIKPAKDVNDPNELGRVGNQYVGALLNKYQDPRLTMIAYNMGPARTDKWLAAGADMSKLPKETQQYIRGVNLAQGGEVKHYYAGGYEEEQYSPEGVLISGQATRTEPEKPEWEKEWDKKYLKKPKADSKKASPTEVEQFFSRYDNVPTTGNTNVDPRFSNVQGVSDESKKQDFNLIDYIREQQAERKEAAKLDKWQAGLAAGLGMLGGTSQYALENIGKGGQMGVQQLAQSQKLRAAENKAAGELYGNAAQLDLMQKTRGDALRERTRSFDEKQELARSEKLNKAIADALKANPNNVNMLNILESQVGDPSKPLSPEQLTRLDNLRKWKAITENAVRKNFATSGLSSGSSAGWSAVQKG